MTSQVHVVLDGGVQSVRFDRPEKKNALTVEMYRALKDAIHTANDTPGIGVTVILGQPGIFTAGNDIADFLAASDDWTRNVLAFLETVATSRKPLMAAVDGPAVGVGTTLLLHCDLVYASPRASFMTPFVNLGLVPEAGASLLGARLMGHHLAFEMLVMGETFTAERAVQAGFVNRIVPADDLERTTLAAAASLAAKPREAVLLSRRLIRGDEAEIKARIELEVDMFAARMASPEARRAFEDFLRKSVAAPAA